MKSENLERKFWSKETPDRESMEGKEEYTHKVQCGRKSIYPSIVCGCLAREFIVFFLVITLTLTINIFIQN
jgi:hypothetical protein